MSFMMRKKGGKRGTSKTVSAISKKNYNMRLLTITILIEQGKGFLELSDLFFGQLFSHDWK